jgi:hypothetical protein
MRLALRVCERIDVDDDKEEARSEGGGSINEPQKGDQDNTPCDSPPDESAAAGIAFSGRSTLRPWNRETRLVMY